MMLLKFLRRLPPPSISSSRRSLFNFYNFDRYEVVPNEDFTSLSPSEASDRYHISADDEILFRRPYSRIDVLKTSSLIYGRQSPILKPGEWTVALTKGLRDPETGVSSVGFFATDGRLLLYGAGRIDAQDDYCAEATALKAFLDTASSRGIKLGTVEICTECKELCNESETLSLSDYGTAFDPNNDIVQKLVEAMKRYNKGKAKCSVQQIIDSSCNKTARYMAEWAQSEGRWEGAMNVIKVWDKPPTERAWELTQLDMRYEYVPMRLKPKTSIQELREFAQGMAAGRGAC